MNLYKGDVDTCLVVKVVEVARDKYVNVPHDLKNIKSLHEHSINNVNTTVGKKCLIWMVRYTPVLEFGWVDGPQS